MLNRGSYLDRPEGLALFGGVRGKGMHQNFHLKPLVNKFFGKNSN